MPSLSMSSFSMSSLAMSSLAMSSMSASHESNTCGISQQQWEEKKDEEEEEKGDRKQKQQEQQQQEQQQQEQQQQEEEQEKTGSLSYTVGLIGRLLIAVLVACLLLPPYLNARGFEDACEGAKGTVSGDTCICRAGAKLGGARAKSVICKDERECQGKTFEACEVDCRGDFGCAGASFEGSSNVSCTGRHACDKASFQGSSSALCSGQSSCHSAAVRGSSRVTCVDALSCLGAKACLSSNGRNAEEKGCTARLVCTSPDACIYVDLWGDSQARCETTNSCSGLEVGASTTGTACCTDFCPRGVPECVDSDGNRGGEQGQEVFGACSAAGGAVSGTSGNTCTCIAQNGAKHVSCVDSKCQDKTFEDCEVDCSGLAACQGAIFQGSSRALCTGWLSCVFVDLVGNSTATCTSDNSCLGLETAPGESCCTGDFCPTTVRACGPHSSPPPRPPELIALRPGISACTGLNHDLCLLGDSHTHTTVEEEQGPPCICDGSGEACFTDASCAPGTLGCSVKGVESCRFCGFSVYAEIACP